MKNENNTFISLFPKEFELLPSYFKKIGLGILLFLFLTLLLNKFTSVFADYKLLYADVSKILFVIALLFILIAKNKVEDERLLHIRIKAYSGAMLCSIGGFVLHKLQHMLSATNLSNSYEMTVTEFIMSIFICYFIIYWFLKRKN